MKEIKVLIVDDSPFFRKMIENVLTDHKRIKIIGAVGNGLEALDFIKNNDVPDVITLDIEMPEMDGIDTLKTLKENSSNKELANISVIMLSALTKAGSEQTIRALELGACDFITKPINKDVEHSLKNLSGQLQAKIMSLVTKKMVGESSKRAANVVHKVVQSDGNKAAVPSPKKSNLKGKFDVIVVGASTGGPKALLKVLPELCEYFQLPILVVQHMPPTFTRSLANTLDLQCKHTVKEGEDGDIIQDGYIYVAPGGSHLSVKKLGASKRICLTHQPPENGCRPAVDVMFRTVADAYEKNILAIVLTGMGRDGVEGLKSLKEKNTLVIAQDEKSSVVWGMPGSAVEAGLADSVCHLDFIAKTARDMRG